MIHLKASRKEEETKSPNSRWEETIKIRAEINKIEIKKNTKN